MFIHDPRTTPGAPNGTNAVATRARTRVPGGKSFPTIHLPTYTPSLHMSAEQAKKYMGAVGEDRAMHQCRAQGAEKRIVTVLCPLGPRYHGQTQDEIGGRAGHGNPQGTSR